LPRAAAKKEGGEEEDEAPADDMGLAWEMLELARKIFEEQGPEAHLDELAEIHLALGDIMGEQVGRAAGWRGGRWWAGWWGGVVGGGPDGVP
jgi:hypothetical protein